MAGSKESVERRCLSSRRAPTHRAKEEVAAAAVSKNAKNVMSKKYRCR